MYAFPISKFDTIETSRPSGISKSLTYSEAWRMNLWKTVVSVRSSYGSSSSGFIRSFLEFLEIFLRRRVVEVELLLEVEPELLLSLNESAKPSKVQNMQYKTIRVCEYNNWFLVVDGGSGLWFTTVYGTPFPTGTADQVNSYLHEAAITVA